MKVNGSMYKCAIIITLITCAQADVNAILREVHTRQQLQRVIADALATLTRDDVTCAAVVTDTVYLNVFDATVFRRTADLPYVMTVVEEREDLLSPNYHTLESLRAARKDGCSVYLILLANGLQAARLLRFGDRHRVIDTRAKFLMLHDFRLFHSELHYLWKRIVNVVFMKHHSAGAGSGSKAWFDLTTVPFPNPIRNVLVTRRVDIWRNGKFHYNRALFKDKTSDLNGEPLNVVYLDHVPSVVVTPTDDSSKVGGIEIEVVRLLSRRLVQVGTTAVPDILPTSNVQTLLCSGLKGTEAGEITGVLKTLAQKMHFNPKLYQPANAELHKWGHKQPNGSYSGLLGEMVNGRADLALGNLQYNPYHLELTDLSIPYTSQCWTFVTPEALSDNSWKTLILPFKLYMWVAVLLVLLITGAIFYGLARYYITLQEFVTDDSKSNTKNSIKMQPQSDAKPVGLYLFGEIINSILYTYGMLLVVSLPKLPTGWSIRLLTGWYWLYCILLVVSYRASMTAILANPAPRVTIDTLKELADSKVTCGGWGAETKKFFADSLDEIGHKIGEKFETIDDPMDAANKVAQGIYAYYDNRDFLKYISVKRKHVFVMDSNRTESTNVTVTKTESERNLHIMTDCVVHIPISIGFHKNSPLKPLADIYMRRVVEVGLVEKWLDDAMHPIRSLETNEEEIKALMNLKKLYGAFIALAIGYTVSAIGLIGELIHWNLIVKKDPNFDKYAVDLYYKNKKH